MADFGGPTLKNGGFWSKKGLKRGVLSESAKNRGGKKGVFFQISEKIRVPPPPEINWYEILDKILSVKGPNHPSISNPGPGGVLAEPKRPKI